MCSLFTLGLDKNFLFWYLLETVSDPSIIDSLLCIKFIHTSYNSVQNFQISFIKMFECIALQFIRSNCEIVYKIEYFMHKNHYSFHHG